MTQTDRQKETTYAESLLDRIADTQAEVASRYKPVMSVEDFVKREEAIDYLIVNVLKEGIDYGYVPGTKPTKQQAAGEYQPKPSLFKAGAERVCAFFGYVPDYQEIACIEEWTPAKYGEMLFYYKFKCVLSKDSKPVGVGIGSASTWESKYRYRKGERFCPECEKAGAIIKGQEKYGGGWLCFQKKGGCGAKFKDGDPVIENQVTDRVANPDVADMINVVQKMGQKRSYVAATLTATGLSGRFSQDTEDLPAPLPKPVEDKVEQAPAQQQDVPGPLRAAFDGLPGTTKDVLTQCKDRLESLGLIADYRRLVVANGIMDINGRKVPTATVANVRAAALEMWALCDAKTSEAAAGKDDFVPDFTEEVLA